MSIIRPGNYLTYLTVGKKTIKDNLKFIKTESPSVFKFERIRKRQDTLIPKFVKYERNTLTFEHLDKKNKQLGGVVRISTKTFNFAQMIPYYYNQLGYFTANKLVYAKFDTEHELTAEDKEFEDILAENVQGTKIIFRHSFEMTDDALNYKLEVNPELQNRFFEQSENTEGELVPIFAETFTEKLFFNLGYTR